MLIDRPNRASRLPAWLLIGESPESINPIRRWIPREKVQGALLHGVRAASRYEEPPHPASLAHLKTIAETPAKNINDILFKAYIAEASWEKTTVLNSISHAIVCDLLALLEGVMVRASDKLFSHG